MAKIKLTRPVILGEGANKKLFPPGEHSVEDHFLIGWFIPHLISAGELVIEDPPAEPEGLLDVSFSPEGITFDGDETPGLAVDGTSTKQVENKAEKKNSLESLAPGKKGAPAASEDKPTRKFKALVKNK